MPVPAFETILLPLLQLAGDGKIRSIAEARPPLATHFNLTQAELEERLPSGKITRWHSRIGWASFYLMKAGLIEKPKRGYFVITGRGRELLAEKPTMLDIDYLRRFPEFIDFLDEAGTSPEPAEPAMRAGEATVAPDEAIDRAFQVLRSALASELLETIKAASPAFFEKLVVELLLKMGYGGTQAEAGRAIGQSGDEGIDGIINEDRLGFLLVPSSRLSASNVSAQVCAWKVGRSTLSGSALAFEVCRARRLWQWAAGCCPLAVRTETARLRRCFDVRSKPNRPPFRRRRFRQRIEHRVNQSEAPPILLVHLHHRLLEIRERASDILLRGSELAEPDEHAHDVDAHRNSVRRVQNVGPLSGAVLGEGVGQVLDVAAAAFVQGRNLRP
jgi:hypothetical protein